MRYVPFFPKFLFACLLLMSMEALANNIQVTNVSLTDQNTTDNFTMVEFDISWENSWRLSGGPANWDAAWVFVKYRVGGGPWLHAWLNDAGHFAPTGSTTSAGLLDPGAPFNAMTNPGMGAFIYRSGPGSGTFSLANVKLRWNYGANGLDDDAQVDIKVFAIEQVYIPEGAYRLGDGALGAGQFYDGTPESADMTSFLVNSEAAIDVNPMNLYYEVGFGDQSGPVPIAFPKGYNDFYIMKYELSQQAYSDFLNTLTRQQQSSNVSSSFMGSNYFALANSTTPQQRNGVRFQEGLVYSGLNSPAFFYCDLNNNKLPGDDNDGEDLPCNYMRWRFVASYLDWAGLRPITELEFEKACRGSLMPVAGEYAWGSTVAIPRSGFANEGAATELPLNPFANVSVEYSPGFPGMIRCGAFATSNSDRVKAGAGYFGAMELSGNLHEIVITIGNSQGRSFDGRHGDGLLDNAGLANVPNWPSNGMSVGAGVRGGYYLAFIATASTSDRSLAATIQNFQQASYGLRGMRTAPN